MVYAQHMDFLDNSDDNRYPRVAFVKKLTEQVAKWKEEGDQIVIMQDANKDSLLEGKLISRDFLSWQPLESKWFHVTHPQCSKKTQETITTCDQL